MGHTYANYRRDHKDIIKGQILSWLGLWGMEKISTVEYYQNKELFDGQIYYASRIKEANFIEIRSPLKRNYNRVAQRITELRLLPEAIEFLKEE